MNAPQQKAHAGVSERPSTDQPVMLPRVRSSFGRLTDGLRTVNRDPAHFRAARWGLLAQGLAVVGLGIAGFISAAVHPGSPQVGAPVSVLALTPWHSTLLLVLGSVAILGCVRRRAAVAGTASSAVIYAVLMIVCAVAAANQAPGPLGFEARGVVVYGVLGAVNFALLYWLFPDELEGPNWVRGSDPHRSP